MKKARIHIITLIALLIITPDLLSAQEHSGKLQEGWEVGLHTGFYFANKHSANYYNGVEANENSISFVLDNKYRRDEILEYFNATTYQYSQEDLPQQMRYDPDINIGFLARNNITDNWGIFFNFNYVKLVAKGNFILEFDPDQIVTEPDRRVFEIYGIEDRTNIDIGIHRQFSLLSPGITYYGEIGININNTRVRESAIQLGDLNYSIVNRYGPGRSYVPNLPQTEYNFRLGGIGVGAFGGMGIKFLFNDQLTLDVGITSYVKYINLERYKNFTLHLAPYARIMYNGFFDFL
jgi:hypothetical protein